MKLLLDLSLEIDTEDIVAAEEFNITIKKEINGQKFVLDLPVAEKNKRVVSGELFNHYCQAQTKGKGFWLRVKNSNDLTGLHLVHDKQIQKHLPH